MAESNKKWYVLRAVSGKEAKVKEYIETDVKLRGLTDKVSQVLIPTEKVVQVRNGKRIVKEKSYLLFDLRCASSTLAEAKCLGSVRLRVLKLFGKTKLFFISINKLIHTYFFCPIGDFFPLCYITKLYAYIFFTCKFIGKPKHTQLKG